MYLNFEQVSSVKIKIHTRPKISIIRIIRLIFWGENKRVKPLLLPNYTVFVLNNPVIIRVIVIRPFDSVEKQVFTYVINRLQHQHLSGKG